MSLQTKLTALAQAVGADIKALNAKVATTESYIQTAGGATLNATSGVLPVGAITQSSNPAPFSRNADGTLTCLQDGVYQVNAVINCSSGLAANTNVQYQINVNGSAVGYTTNAPVWPHTTLPWLGKVLAGQVVSVYVAGIGATSLQCAVAAFSAARTQAGPQGVKGDKGDVGGNATVPIDPWHNVGAAGEPAFAAGWQTHSAGTYGTVAFRKDPLGNVQLRGTLQSTTTHVAGDVIFTLPVGYRTNRIVIWDTVQDTTVQSRLNVLANGQVQFAGGTNLPSGSFIALEGLWFDTESVTQMPTGPQGPKGDPGGVNVLTTLNWNTALTPNFYRSTTDFLQQTINGPGDALNPPPQAGIVSTLDNGTLVQRVWDLQTQRAFTRYLSGSTWTAWVADLAKPSVLTAQIVGGATPEEGDERYFQTAAMLAQGVIWKFRYNKVQNKWHFVGGSEFLFTAATLSANSGASAIDATNLAFTAVLSGSYDVSWGARMYQNPSGANSGNILLYADQMRGASAIASPGMDVWAGPLPGQSWSAVIPSFRAFRFDSVQNGDIIRLRSQSINYNAAIESPIMRIKPVSVLM